MLSAMPWKCMVSCSGYKHPNATNHAMKSPTTILKSAPLEKRWVAKVYSTCNAMLLQSGWQVEANGMHGSRLPAEADRLKSCKQRYVIQSSVLHF